MFTKTDLEKLIQFKSRDAVSAAVDRIPEDELRFALTLAIMSYKQTVDLENELWYASFARYSAMEEELERLRDRVRNI